MAQKKGDVEVNRANNFLEFAKSKRKHRLRGKAKEILQLVALEKKVRVEDITVQILLECRCVNSRFPKRQYSTLKEAREGKQNYKSIYPCSCGFWHRTSMTSKPGDTFKCIGCSLFYVKTKENWEFCSKGCERKWKKIKF